MQIVIEIPEEVYKACIPYKDTPIISSLANYNSEMTYAIANGTILPKGHGRLKDIDEIYWYWCTTEYDCPYKSRDCKDCDRAECSKTQVDSIPVLIPEDKEDEA